MKNSVKDEQIKRFGYIGFGFVLVFVVMMVFRGNAESMREPLRLFQSPKDR